ncbi:hypothetical protein PVNG_02183 [Plasmodium vivax North Korean]|uniref:VIR protein n=1 Tax=Plasmodium vivax North Korean TaxID=1035514 RepID=A0A0J9TTN3_PLAVI|nr:hypothetical protein PVNG_02183 [Plasmodium vivax North Korean]
MNILNNIDDEIEKELTYPSHKNAIINSRVATYNVAYGSYSFLKNVWNTYGEFDNTVVGDTNYHKYVGVCEGIVKNYGDEKPKHKDFCMKLVRNLGHHYSNPKYYKPNRDRCHILYNWIYNKKNDYKKSNDIIPKCFEDYTDFMKHVNVNHMCSYESYNNVYEDPIKMTILDIFNDNMHNIIPILKGEYDADEFSPQNFVCECVKIYRNIYNTYCANTDQREGKENITCAKLKALKTTYDNYLLRNAAIKNKIPSLDADDNEYSNKCKSKAKGLESFTVSPGRVETFSQSREVSGRNTDSFTPSVQDPDENTGRSMSSTVSTAFSPGGNWIRSGFRGSRGRINDNLYVDRENYLFFNELQGENISSYDTRYNIGYGSS